MSNHKPVTSTNAGTITFGGLPAASTPQNADILPGTQAGSDIKYSLSQLATYFNNQVNFQGVYNNSSPPQFTISNNGFLIKDSSNRNIFDITVDGGGNTSVQISALDSVSISNASSGSFVGFGGNQMYSYIPADLGANNPIFQFVAYGDIPGNSFIEAGDFEFGFSDESSSRSGYYQLTLSDNGGYNTLFYVTGKAGGYISRVGVNGQLTVGIPYGTASNQKAIAQFNSVTQALMPPIWNSTQEGTNITGLGSSDKGLMWYNSTIDVPTFWDGLDSQRILAIDNIIQGSNMTITNNGDGTVTFSSTGGSGSGSQITGSFTVFKSVVSTTPSTSSYVAIAIDVSKFIAVRQDGTSVTTATIDSVTTPIIQNTSSGGTRYFNVTFDFSITPSFADGQNYTFSIAIKRNGGGIVVTNFQTNYNVPTINTASGLKPISLSGLVDLDTNDYTYVVVTCNTASEPFVAYTFNGVLCDTTVSGLPSTNALSQGSNNLYLSQNGGTTYQNLSGSATIGHLSAFNSVGGQLIDSGHSAADFALQSQVINYVTVTTSTQQMAMNTVYTNKSMSPVTFTLPPTSSQAGTIEIVGTGRSSWTVIPYEAGQYMEYNGLTATTSAEAGTASDNLTITYAGDGSGEFNLQFSNGMELTLN